MVSKVYEIYKFNETMIKVSLTCSRTGVVYGLSVRGGYVELRCLNRFNKWAVCKQVKQEIFDELIIKYAAQRLKELNDDGRDTLSTNQTTVVAFPTQQVDSRNHD